MNESISFWFADLFFAQVWQVSLLVLVVALLHRWFARDRPHLAHALWILVLLKCVMPPVVSSPTSPFSWLAGGSSVDARSVIDPNLVDESHSRNSLSTSQGILPTSAARSIVVRAQVVPKNGLAEGPSSQLSGPLVPSSHFRETKGAMPKVGKTIGQTSWGYWPVNLLLGVWFVGFVVSLAIAVIRWRLFRNWIGRSKVVNVPKVQEVFRDLVERLGVPKMTQVEILRVPVGPAVIGILRPTILIPEAMVAGKSSRDLEPVLAHELIHVRRGDLWWSLLQTVSKSIFWFNPLVWWASAMVTRESERSCDEETIATLACSPKRYANSLIDVLELKHRLRVAPAVPGVRPIDITSARLERVMKLGNGCQRRTPTWIWATLFLGCCVVLPGASFAWSQQERLPQIGESQPLARAPAATTANPDSAAITNFRPGPGFKLSMESAEVASPEKAETLPRTYYQSEDLQFMTPSSKLPETIVLVRESRQEREIGWLLTLAGERDWVSVTAEKRILQGLADGRVIRDLRIAGTKLSFSATPKDTASIDENLMLWQAYGLDAVVLQTRFLTIPRDHVKELGLDWRFGETASLSRAPHANGIVVINSVYPALGEKEEDANQVVSTAFTSGDRITMLALATEDELIDIVNQTTVDSESIIFQAPTTLVRSGHEAIIHNGVEHPFVVGMKRTHAPSNPTASDIHPAVKIVHEGTTIKHFPIVNVEDGSVQLILDIEMTELLDVDIVELPVAEGLTLQQPKVNCSSILSDITIPNDKHAAVICYFDKNDQGEEVAELVVVSSSIVKFESDVLGAAQSPTNRPQAGIPSKNSESKGLDTSGDVEESIDDHIDFEIRGADVPGDVTLQNQQLQGWLEKMDLTVSISGVVEVQIDEASKVRSFRGKQLRIASSNAGSFSIQGEEGVAKFTIRDEQPCELVIEFSGKLESVYEGAVISADCGMIKVEVDDDSREIGSWDLSGNVRVSLNGVRVSADRILFSERSGDAIMELSGNAVLHRDIPGEDLISLSAENIRWNVSSSEFATSRTSNFEKPSNGVR